MGTIRFGRDKRHSARGTILFVAMLAAFPVLAGCCCGSPCGGRNDFAPWVAGGGPQASGKRSGLTFVRIKIINSTQAPIRGTWGMGKAFGPIPVGGYCCDSDHYSQPIDAIGVYFDGGGSCAHAACGQVNRFDVKNIGAAGQPGTCAYACAPMEDCPPEAPQCGLMKHVKGPKLVPPGLPFVRIRIVNNTTKRISGQWGAGQPFGPIEPGKSQDDNQNFPGGGVNAVELSFEGGGHCAHNASGGLNIFTVQDIGPPEGQADCLYSTGP
jgi:hypothetical protein